MLVRDIEKYKEMKAPTRELVKWHPWAQVTLWLEDFDAFNGHAWTMTEANDWVKAKVQENWAMLEEVNADPLHRGLIYPPLLTDWVSYVITDIRLLRSMLSVSGSCRSIRPRVSSCGSWVLPSLMRCRGTYGSF